MPPENPSEIDTVADRWLDKRAPRQRTFDVVCSKPTPLPGRLLGPVRVVFFGTPDFAVPCLEALLATTHSVVGVVTQPDKPKGRGQDLVAPPVKDAAIAAGIPVLQPASVRKPPFAPELAALAPDIAVVVAYGKILPAELLAVPKRGCINVHGSLLPRWRGAAPIQWAVIAGDETSGVCTMQMDEGMDTGDLLLTREVALAPDETAGSLFERLAPLGAELLVETLARLDAGTVTPRKQDAATATHARMLEKADGRVDWTKAARDVDCHVRGMSPWPGAFTTGAGKVLKVHRVGVTSLDGAGDAGAVIASKERIEVVCGRGRVALLEVQAEGGKRMSAFDFWRGKGSSITRLGVAA